jgi:hypothetical protein
MDNFQGRFSVINNRAYENSNNSMAARVASRSTGRVSKGTKTPIKSRPEEPQEQIQEKISPRSARSNRRRAQLEFEPVRHAEAKNSPIRLRIPNDPPDQQPGNFRIDRSPTHSPSNNAFLAPLQAPPPTVRSEQGGLNQHRRKLDFDDWAKAEAEAVDSNLLNGLQDRHAAFYQGSHNPSLLAAQRPNSRQTQHHSGSEVSFRGQNTHDPLSRDYQNAIHHAQSQNSPSRQGGRQNERSHSHPYYRQGDRQSDRQHERSPPQKNNSQPENFPQQPSSFGVIERWWSMFLANRASSCLRSTMVGLWMLAKMLEIGILFGILFIINMTVFSTKVQPNIHMIPHQWLQSRLVWSLLVVFLGANRLLIAMVTILLTDFKSILSSQRYLRSPC